MNTVVNKIPLVLGVAFLLASCSPIAESKTEVEVKEYKRHVGDILFDASVDDANFKPCHEDLTTQYYAFGKGIMYKGEKAELDRQIRNAFEKAQEETEESGYIIIRFIINCEGKSGWFRMEEIDMNYKPKEFSTAISKNVLQIVKELKGWEAGTYEGKSYDYYQYLTFKIVDGQIQSILP